MNFKLLHRLAALLTVFTLLSVGTVRSIFATPSVVHAVLFYSPTCGHCHYVITEILPPLFKQYRERFQILEVNTTSPDGQALYLAALEHFGISPERRGVPTLILDKTVLVGSLEIPEQLPGLIDQYLARGGNDWPDIPGLAKFLQENTPAANTVPEPTPDPATSATASEDLMSKFRRDPIGNILSIFLLAGMLVVVGDVLNRMRRAWRERSEVVLLAVSGGGWQSWAGVTLCLIGLGVSIYMAYVETTHTTAVCGPIGDCNTVQQSPYALLFGLMPVGVLGILGYAAMLIAWAGIQWGPGPFKTLLASGLVGMALFGTLFSIYLTFLEPFVIGATCVWCLTSAMSMTLILLILSTSRAVHTEPARPKTRRKVLN